MWLLWVALKGVHSCCDSHACESGALCNDEVVRDTRDHTWNPFQFLKGDWYITGRVHFSAVCSGFFPKDGRTQVHRAQAVEQALLSWWLNNKCHQLMGYFSSLGDCVVRVILSSHPPHPPAPATVPTPSPPHTPTTTTPSPQYSSLHILNSNSGGYCNMQLPFFFPTPFFLV